MNWLPLTSLEGLDNLVQQSFTEQIAIFKHSTRCSISRMIKDRVERGVPRQHMPAYYLDLLEHRDISNSIATRVNVQHESPQLLILRNGVCTSHASHNAIQPEMLGI
jgi:bacillithiol system protein YtxJ